MRRSKIEKSAELDDQTESLPDVITVEAVANGRRRSRRKKPMALLQSGMVLGSVDGSPEESEPHGEYLRFCRFCKKSESPRDTLYHPCRCEGALKFSHKNCLKNVIRTTNNHECPDCGHKVEFTIVYGMQDMYVDLGQVAVDTAK
uniref:RING-type E3 ubiquitin transferase n=1 Tax=Steinernema glaseri TaxID=37863 RepID=A0A1I8AMY6_9BILA